MDREKLLAGSARLSSNDDLLPSFDLIPRKLKILHGVPRDSWRDSVTTQRFHHRIVQHMDRAKFSSVRHTLGEKLIGFGNTLRQYIRMMQKRVEHKSTFVGNRIQTRNKWTKRRKNELGSEPSKS